MKLCVPTNEVTDSGMVECDRRSVVKSYSHYAGSLDSTVLAGIYPVVDFGQGVTGPTKSLFSTDWGRALGGSKQLSLIMEVGLKTASQVRVIISNLIAA